MKYTSSSLSVTRYMFWAVTYLYLIELVVWTRHLSYCQITLIHLFSKFDYFI